MRSLAARERLSQFRAHLHRRVSRLDLLPMPCVASPSDKNLHRFDRRCAHYAADQAQQALVKARGGPGAVEAPVDHGRPARQGGRGRSAPC